MPWEIVASPPSLEVFKKNPGQRSKEMILEVAFLQGAGADEPKGPSKPCDSRIL